MNARKKKWEERLSLVLDLVLSLARQQDLMSEGAELVLLLRTDDDGRQLLRTTDFSHDKQTQICSDIPSYFQVPSTMAKGLRSKCKRKARAEFRNTIGNVS